MVCPVLVRPLPAKATEMCVVLLINFTADDRHHLSRNKVRSHNQLFKRAFLVFFLRIFKTIK